MNDDKRVTGCVVFSQCMRREWFMLRCSGTELTQHKKTTTNRRRNGSSGGLDFGGILHHGGIGKVVFQLKYGRDPVERLTARQKHLNILHITKKRNEKGIDALVHVIFLFGRLAARGRERRASKWSDWRDGWACINSVFRSR